MQPMEIERVQLLERRPTTTAHHTMMNNSTSSINNGDPLSISPSRQQQHLPSPHNQRLVLPNGSTPTHENSNYHPTSSSSRRETSCGCNIVFHDLTRAGLLGVTTGASVAVFKLMIESLRAEAYSTTLMQNTIIPSAIIPGLGGLVVGILALCGPFPPGLKGIIQETDRESKAIFFGDECNQQFVPSAFFRKTIAAIFTLGSGCSLGPEGPSVEIGVSLSRILSNKISHNTNTSTTIPITANVAEVVIHNRLLLACGGAAGVAAGFNAPIAGIFFALEVIQVSFSNRIDVSTTNNISAIGTSRHNYKKKNDNAVDENINHSIEAENLISTKGGISSIVLSSVLAALVSKTILGDELVFKVARYSLKTPLLELPLYLMLGSLCGVFAFIFTQLAACCKGFFDGEFGPRCARVCIKKIPKLFKPLIGGLFCGCVGIYYPQVLFFGYETLNNLLTKTTIQTTLLLTLLVIKMTTTSVAAGSGLVGGLFAPSLFFGGMLGASFRNVIGYWLESIGHGIAELPAYAMIGSASVLAALIRAPLTGSLILFECTREYDVILPLMASAGLASVVADLLETWMKREPMQLSASPIPTTPSSNNSGIDRSKIVSTCDDDPEITMMLAHRHESDSPEDELLLMPSLLTATTSRQNSNGGGEISK